MRILLTSTLVLAALAGSVLLLDGAATAQDAAEPQSVVRARAQRAAQPGATFTVGTIRGVSQRSLSELCGTRVTPEVLQRLRGARRIQADPIPEPAERHFDLREKAAFPAVNQQSCGSCWIFGSVAALAGNGLFKDATAASDFSEQYVGDCLFNQTGRDPCEGGWPDVALRFLRDHGTFAEARFPYVGRFQRRSPLSDAPYRAVNFGYVATNPDLQPSVSDIKKRLSANGTLVVAIAAGVTFQNYTSGVFNFDEPAEPINHAVTLVGWDDTVGGGVWILKNSWGPEWGDKGYMLIGYNRSQVGYGAMWVESAFKKRDDVPSDDLSAEILKRISWWEANFPAFVPKKK